MLEISECYTIKNQMEETILGKKISKVVKGGIY